MLAPSKSILHPFSCFLQTPIKYQYQCSEWFACKYFKKLQLSNNKTISFIYPMYPSQANEYAHWQLIFIDLKQSWFAQKAWSLAKMMRKVKRLLSWLVRLSIIRVIQIFVVTPALKGILEKAAKKRGQFKSLSVLNIWTGGYLPNYLFICLGVRIWIAWYLWLKVNHLYWLTLFVDPKNFLFLFTYYSMFSSHRVCC